MLAAVVVAVLVVVVVVAVVEGNCHLLEEVVLWGFAGQTTFAEMQ